MGGALILFIILLLSGPSYAEWQEARLMLFSGGATDAATSYYCTTCPFATGGADMVCEDSHVGDANGVCNWTVAETGGAAGDIDFAASPDNDPALGCTDIDMTYAIKVTKTSADSGYAHGYTSISNVGHYGQFYFKYTAATLADGTCAIILKIANISEEPLVWIRLCRSGASNYLNALTYDGGYVSDNSGTALAADTWAGVRYYLNKTGTDFQWWSDENNDGTFTDRGTDVTAAWSRDIEIVMVGQSEATTNQATYYVVGLKLDATDMPSDCTR